MEEDSAGEEREHGPGRGPEDDCDQEEPAYDSEREQHNASEPYGDEISEIARMPWNERSPDETVIFVRWLMLVWPLAKSMGFNMCDILLRDFKYEAYEEGVTIITEGERDSTFYIIVSGSVGIHKNGLGYVGVLGKGKCIGEIALTAGQDLRTASVKAETKVEMLSLHKNDFDIFVHNAEEAERRRKVFR
jgi:hypothetical protein